MSDLTGESCGRCRGYGESLGIYSFGEKCQPCDGRGYFEYEEEGEDE